MEGVPGLDHKDGDYGKRKSRDVTERKTGTKKREKIGWPDAGQAGFPKTESMIFGFNLTAIVISKDETRKHEK